MCEAPARRLDEWRGWLDLPAPAPSSGTGPWLDLSHVITEDLSRVPLVPAPRIRQVQKKPEYIANVTEVQMVVHNGTHLDAPCHFIADAPAIDDIPLERLYGEGVIWKLDMPDHGVIEPEHLEAATPRMREGDIVYLDTGRGRHINTPAYEDHAHLSPEAAEWLVAHGAKIVGVDFSTPDLTAHLRPENFQFPVHHILLGRGVLIAEHMTNLEPLSGRRIETMFMAVNIGGSDGAPARVVARPVD
ncbi:cyclase family protein [Microbaculum marinum]|uniref:Cyclase family protein n=1 Tax=Microbaculum marinum TaxID=1764581 RepID=A0AAW9RY61_9HYPH